MLYVVIHSVLFLINIKLLGMRITRRRDFVDAYSHRKENRGEICDKTRTKTRLQFHFIAYKDVFVRLDVRSLQNNVFYVPMHSVLS